MSTRERWIVYPLLFLTLGITLRDKVVPPDLKPLSVDADEIRCRSFRADSVRCGDLIVVGNQDNRCVELGTTAGGAGQVEVFGPGGELIFVAGASKQGRLRTVRGGRRPGPHAGATQRERRRRPTQPRGPHPADRSRPRPRWPGLFARRPSSRRRRNRAAGAAVSVGRGFSGDGGVSARAAGTGRNGTRPFSSPFRRIGGVRQEPRRRSQSPSRLSPAGGSGTAGSRLRGFGVPDG